MKLLLHVLPLIDHHNNNVHNLDEEDKHLDPPPRDSPEADETCEEVQELHPLHVPGVFRSDVGSKSLEVTVFEKLAMSKFVNMETECVRESKHNRSRAQKLSDLINGERCKSSCRSDVRAGEPACDGGV